MAQWDNLGSSGNVDDRRGLGSGVMLGGGSLIIALLASLALNYIGLPVSPNDINAVLNQVNGVQSQTLDKSRQDPEFKGLDNYEKFVGTVLGSTDDMWSNIFKRNGYDYEKPKLVLFRNTTRSGCGIASSATGPHYCPIDKTIYLDETFFNELHDRFGASKGETAQAYVIAHEVGHNVQNQLGILDKMQNSRDKQNAAILTELQADCYAGLWLNSIKDKNVFESGDIEQAMSAVSAVGDDNVQETIQGRVTPENWTHGSSQQRLDAMKKGYETGKVSECEINL